MATHKHILAGAASTALALGGFMAFDGTARADIVHNDDVIITFSLCVGNDCVNGESFGFDTLRLKENNLRIHFDDTSSSASFPNNDWRIIVNDTGNGGASHWSVEDSTAGRSPFRIEAGAPANSLVVEADGDIGIGTLDPVVEVHVVDGDSPTLRLEQNGSSGFTPQTFDLAANVANFFVRDVTNGSQLPFKIFPGADTNSLVVGANNNVGIGSGNSPSSALHIRRTALGDTDLLKLEANGGAFITLENNRTNDDWFITSQDSADLGRLEFTSFVNGATATVAMAIEHDGDVTIAGGLVTSGGGGACTVADPCDAVFDPAVYKVPSIEEHAEAMWQNKYLPAVGPTKPGEPINVTIKLTRMLNELEKAHIYIEQLHKRIEKLEQM